MTLRKAKNDLARFLGATAAALLLGIACAVAAFVLAIRPVSDAHSGRFFTVEKGASVQSLASALEAKGLIRSAFAFRLLARLEGPSAVPKAGSYRIEANMGAKRILDEFVSGKQALVKVTVPEGYTLGQIAGLLDRLGLTSRDSFKAACSSPGLLAELGISSSSAEGYLYPDTYFFPREYPAEGIVRAMAKTFRERLAGIHGTEGLSPDALNERLILASIVEREYKSADEAPLMASVFYNRLKIRMPLQSCATVVYVITERLGKAHPDIIYDRDLKLEDPYNTYLHRGLPPGPISNPGMTALKAAFSPAKTGYLYFRLVDETAGKHHFSSTLDEHIDARSLFVKKVGG